MACNIAAHIEPNTEKPQTCTIQHTDAPNASRPARRQHTETANTNQTPKNFPNTLRRLMSTHEADDPADTSIELKSILPEPDRKQKRRLQAPPKKDYPIFS